jgi:hypothetical protein
MLMFILTLCLLDDIVFSMEVVMECMFFIRLHYFFIIFIQHFSSARGALLMTTPWRSVSCASCMSSTNNNG